MKKIDINLFVICCFLGIALTILYIHTSTNQNTEFSVLEISPISGLEQKQANLDGTDYTLTSKTAIMLENLRHSTMNKSMKVQLTAEMHQNID